MNNFNTAMLFGEFDEDEKEKINNWLYNSNHNDSIFLSSLFDSWLKLIEKMNDFNISRDQFIRTKYLNLESTQELAERIDQTLNLKEINENDVKKTISLESSIFSILNEQIFQPFFKKEINLGDKNLYRKSKREERSCKIFEIEKKKFIYNFKFALINSLPDSSPKKRICH
jgi:hypothetical protein